MNKPVLSPRVERPLAGNRRRYTSMAQEALLAKTLAEIDARFPKRKTPGDIFERLIAAGQPVLIVSGGRAMSFNEERGE